MTSTQALVAGVELGGTKVICTLATAPDDVRAEVSIRTTTPAETLGLVHDQLADWARNEPITAVGYASFGPIELNPASPDYGRIVNTTKPGWSGADVLATGRGLGLPLGFDTDVNGAALAEGRWGAARGLSTFAYITVGTGVGVGSIVNGRAVRGLGHSEAGHLRVPRVPGATFPGICSFHGDCVEGLVSGPAIEAAAGRPAEALAADDPVWDEVVHGLAMLVHNLALTLAPERVLIGGGVGMGQAHLLPRVRRSVVESLNAYGGSPAIASGIEQWIQHPELKDRAGPLGAVALAIDALGA
ncbi:fructokinase [Brevundimonas alba]|uniref:fructokinase n=1 Tax=Brevundimonas alba TaxID=74314 RepID=A0A7X6BLY6_9CAUL|nr:ROK family protein [Brevundimonas alba]NJC39802.1 fructokinase [Brevundimonas alba]